MEQQEYYTNYQQTLLNSLTILCVEQKRLSRGVLPETIDIT